LGSQANARTSNTDDGNLNYNEGLVSNTVRATGEMALRWRQFGAYVRGAAFYDFENQSSDPAGIGKKSSRTIPVFCLKMALCRH
jgi:hypothetical protein